MASDLMLSIVVPAYNEENRLDSTLVSLTGFLAQQPYDWEVRVVDDGSLDGTCRVVDARARTEPRIVLQREPHRGKGGAVKAGLMAARGGFRFICDADLSMPVTELPRFLPPQLQNFDVAIGSREGHGARRIGEPLSRHLAGRVFNYAVQQLTVRGIEDTQCGFKMFTAAAVEAIFPLVTVDGWAFDIEVLCIARAKKLRIVEVPIEWHYRRESQLSLVRDGVRMMREMLQIRARARRGEYDRQPAATR
ncbi:MAG TPA: dolichyl-phosphate beta-glucosyltransferase [Vicinamibacterales bacterium]|nr:dolichyl-phosphate beta-glucosyltransferase [Vicinamibacterales bacterium]